MEQSLPYLRDPQSSVRLAAVRFLGESQPLAPFGPAWPRPCSALAAVDTPTMPQRASASLCPLPQAGLGGHLAQFHSHVAAGGPWASPVEGEGGRAGVTLLGAHWELGLMELCAQGVPRGS